MQTLTINDMALQNLGDAEPTVERIFDGMITADKMESQLIEELADHYRNHPEEMDPERLAFYEIKNFGHIHNAKITGELS